MVGSDRPENRWVVLGASNVANLLPSLLRHTGRSTTERQTYLCACGHGRSYGLKSRFFWRRLPPILSSDLWDWWRQLPPAESERGLITDIGNDLIYGVRPQLVARWAIEAAQRLGERCQRVVVAGLPVVSLQSARRWQLDLLRRIVFPSTPLSLDDAVSRAMELDERLREWVDGQSGDRWVYVAPDPAWYGLDPIHVRRRFARDAWSRWLGPLQLPSSPDVAGPTSMSTAGRSLSRSQLPAWWRVRWASAAQRELLGRNRVTQQPALRWDADHWLALF